MRPAFLSLVRTAGLLGLAATFACTEAPPDKGDEADDPAAEDSDSEGDDDGGEDGGSVDDDTGDSTPPCEEGLEVGQCPPDLPLIDGTEALHAFSDYRGGPVLIIGTAEW